MAVIDDGIDASLERFNIVEGTSFADWDGRFGDFFVSPSGHGTLMAGLICRVCPNAKLYIAKLQANGEVHISVESATRVSFLLIAIYSRNC